MNRKEQPAKESYFLGPVWKDLKKFILKLWKMNCESAGKYFLKYKKKGIMRPIGIFWLICSVSVLIYGTLFFLAVCFAFSVTFAVLFILMYIMCLGIRALDFIYLKSNKIFTACPECKEYFLIPAYECPNCGKKHTDLSPGKYGIFYRKCNCGQKLGTCFLTGRKHYQAYCSWCGHKLSDSENKSICIPVVGGRSVGKTAFITAFSKEFIDNIAPMKGWETEIYNDEKKELYNEIVSDYMNGTTRMTDRAMDVYKTSSISFSFFLKGNSFKTERLIHVYDIAGEIFTDNTENEIQKQYEYCQGIVMIIDPFSIPMVKNKFENQLRPEDIAGIGNADTGGIVDVFLNKLREVTGLSDKKMNSTPIALVISKVDVPGLVNELGEKAVQNVFEEMKNKNMNVEFMDAEDYVCRRFLSDNGMESLISGIDIKFKNNRFFACSSIGHARDHGKYNPNGVMEPMEWILKNADSALGRRLDEYKFGKVPVNMEVQL